MNNFIGGMLILAVIGQFPGKSADQKDVRNPPEKSTAAVESLDRSPTKVTTVAVVKETPRPKEQRRLEKYTSPSGIVVEYVIEEDAIFNNDQKDKNLAGPAVGMVRTMGWRCDSISSLQSSSWSRSFSMKCNGYNYVYEFKDRGGTWTVSLAD